ncbi:MAG: MFS transporter [Lutispora sp.]|nr:MFS transporter [Lutispora sp.]MDD4834587.1 MFS transporter [Lutispora sp.]
MDKNKTKKLMTYRWIVLGILIFAYMIVFFHRLAVAVVREDLVSEFGMSSVTFANLSSTYFYAYMLMQIPSGILADTLGARITVTLGTLAAGMGSIIFGFASNIFWIFLGRLLVGLGVSVVFISILKIQSQWFKESEFATLSGISSFFGNLGGIFAQTPLVLLTAAITWRYSFVAIGIFTIIIAIMCYLLVRNSPSDMGFSTIEELEGKEKRVASSGKIDLIKGLKAVIVNPYTWPSFFMFAGFYGGFGALSGTWGSSYIVQVYGMSNASAANYMTAVVLGLAIGSIIIGKVSDNIKKRKLPMILYGVIYVACWALMVFWNGGKPPIEVLIPLLFVLGFSCSAFILGWGCSKEVNPSEIAGISTSVVNIGGFFGAAILPPMIGGVIDRYGGTLTAIELYQKAFLYCFVFALIGFAFTFLIKETNCENIYSELKK